MWTSTLPVISTVHLPEWLINDLEAGTYNGPDIEHASYSEGVFVRLCNVSDDLVEGFPEALIEVRQWAINKGFEDWVRFDSDGDRIEELTDYNW